MLSDTAGALRHMLNLQLEAGSGLSAKDLHFDQSILVCTKPLNVYLRQPKRRAFYGQRFLYSLSFRCWGWFYSRQ